MLGDKGNLSFNCFGLILLPPDLGWPRPAHHSQGKPSDGGTGGRPLLGSGEVMLPGGSPREADVLHSGSRTQL